MCFAELACAALTVLGTNVLCFEAIVHSAVHAVLQLIVHSIPILHGTGL